MPSSNFNLEMIGDEDDLPLLARSIVEGMLTGLHRSPYVGYGHEFESYRPYAPGDNLRFVDWKVWSRTDEWYVKLFEDETNFVGHIFLDASGSMDLGTGGEHKYRYGRRLAAALAYLMIIQRDAPGLVIWNARELTYLPPRHSKQQVEIWAALPQGRPRGNAALPDDLRHLLEGITRRGMAVVISDFLAEKDEAIELCETLRNHRQEVVAFQVLCPQECDLSLEEDVVLVDNETGEERVVQPDEARANYQALLEAFCAGIEKRCWEVGIDYHRLRTDAPPEEALRAYLLKRESTFVG
ncbi:MAG TPA: DUF58 domain-containing protein [Candidatus Methylacidiphilales bacterium]|jgi:uncharacterized protein (DUF58 family)|nr:DUF58 domain-containing protein [Candidatus Methylacidiphilales bacterium]